MTPVLKSQSSEKEKTADKKCKNTKVQAEVHSEQKMKSVGGQRDLKRTSESHPVSSDSRGEVLKSQMRSSTRVGKSANSSSDLPFLVMLLGIFMGAVWKLEIKEMKEINGVLTDVSTGTPAYSYIWVYVGSKPVFFYLWIT